MENNNPNHSLVNLVDIQDKGNENITPFEKLKENIQEEIINLIEQEEINTLPDSSQFPYKIFPIKIQNIITNCNQCLNYNIDFISSSILFALSISVGNTYKVKIKNSWLESALLYIILVAPSGNNKTGPLKFAVNPIKKHDAKTFREYQEKLKVYNNSKKESTKKEGGKVNSLTKPRWNKYLVSDFTNEALAEVHINNKRGIAVYSNELAGWFKNFNRYNKGSDMEFWLSNWDGILLCVDRKSSESKLIDMPFISVGGTIQNGTLFELGKDNRIDSGLIYRMLFAMPSDIKKECWSDDEINPEIINSWEVIVNNLLEIKLDFDENQNPIPQILKYSPEGKEAVFAWQKINVNLINKSDDEYTKGVYNKLEVMIHRIALIIELAHFACDGIERKEISINSVNGAIEAIEYFRYSAIKVNQIITKVNPLDKYAFNKNNFFNVLPNHFSTKEAIIVAEKLNIKERSVKRFLKDTELFKRITYGNYEKKIINH